jgi:prepilin-type processing-associated H-X9-DG protein
VQLVGDEPGRCALVTDLAGAYVDSVLRPAETVMFTDAAFVPREELVEYSFAEPRFDPVYGSRCDPSIHFRHRRRANVGWCDGHVSHERRAFTWSSGFYEGDPDRRDIGWFGDSDDNRCFDLH